VLFSPRSMAKLLIGSVLIVPLLIARWAAARKSARRGFYWSLALAVAFNVLYAFSLVYLYFKLA
jgi:hypothetical protein